MRLAPSITAGCAAALLSATGLADAAPATGTYACTASRFAGGAYQYIPKGSVTLSTGGRYAYRGFEQPSEGRYRVGTGGAIAFVGGHLDGGEATPIDGQSDRYRLVFPTMSDGRWTCGRK